MINFCRSKYRSSDRSFAIVTLARYRAKKLRDNAYVAQESRSPPCATAICECNQIGISLSIETSHGLGAGGCNENQDIRTTAEDRQIKGFGCANVGSKMMIIGYARVSTRVAPIRASVLAACDALPLMALVQHSKSGLGGYGVRS